MLFFLLLSNVVSEIVLCGEQSQETHCLTSCGNNHTWIWMVGWEFIQWFWRVPSQVSGQRYLSEGNNQNSTKNSITLPTIAIVYSRLWLMRKAKELKVKPENKIFWMWELTICAKGIGMKDSNPNVLRVMEEGKKYKIGTDAGNFRKEC